MKASVSLSGYISAAKRLLPIIIQSFINLEYVPVLIDDEILNDYVGPACMRESQSTCSKQVLGFWKIKL